MKNCILKDALYIPTFKQNIFSGEAVSSVLMHKSVVLILIVSYNVFVNKSGRKKKSKYSITRTK